MLFGFTLLLISVAKARNLRPNDNLKGQVSLRAKFVQTVMLFSVLLSVWLTTFYMHTRNLFFTRFLAAPLKAKKNCAQKFLVASIA